MKTMTVNEVEQQLAAGVKLNIIDVREVDEVKEGKIASAIHIPLGLIEFRMHELDKNQEYVMVCRSGNRSGLAARFLEGQGFSVINMLGGMMNWEGPIEY
ncbi:MAG: rhodanese-like domain-containing protein [Bacillota bacterium]|jgi:rhodanese-related sulfurtransferase|uniref:rhodanese-like domain-containing protein n=1 Tax=Bacillaceae TaxID=186817 RepID=UPI0013D4DA08|nr:MULTISPECIES: rhodanese-like domain-containing protein [Bacillaceae]MBG9548246.1 rhodanese domain protein [Cytobacillus firmus]MBG9601741.1 rhodanese domain protein [Cytobacillus firmus]MCS0651693.1 rhodanese-like domain-containing protein [Cytobacillus firmus]MCU1805100.1 rhodanese-like domain-containing protein [Cytobacillus firmus]MED1942668.1 rhodanese-like domain-containing protein [Cytobacillus firmus]